MGERIVAGNDVYSAWDFLNDSPRLAKDALSVHVLIEPSGRLIRCVPDEDRANHAGWSKLGSLEDLNWSFLGAEFLLPGEWVYDPDFLREMRTGNVGFTDEQYTAGGWLYADWMRKYDFPRARITGHSMVAGDDVRGEGKGKVDPGVGFKHGRLTNAIMRATEEAT